MVNMQLIAVASKCLIAQREVRQLLADSGFAEIEIEYGASRYIATATRA
jgi:hypothetical protein